MSHGSRCCYPVVLYMKVPEMNPRATGPLAEACLAHSLSKSQQLVSFLLGLGLWPPQQGDPAIPRRYVSQDMGGPGSHGQSGPGREGWQEEGTGSTRACAALCHPQHTVIADHSLSASHMETTMKLLKTRVQSRLALHKQFASLGKRCPSGLWPEPLSPRTKTTEPCTQIS